VLLHHGTWISIYKDSLLQNSYRSTEHVVSSKWLYRLTTYRVVYETSMIEVTVHVIMIAVTVHVGLCKHDFVWLGSGLFIK